MKSSETQLKYTNSIDETLAVAARIGARLHGGEVIELISDIGGGKTTLTRGLARGMGSSDLVHSPSFTLSNEYRAGSRRMYHFDFYRLTDPGIMAEALAEVLTDTQAVVVIEWADSVEDVLPSERITIQIIVKDDETRELRITCPGRFNYLLEGEN